MSETEESIKIPEEFTKIIKEFIHDILHTFPEYQLLIDKWWKKENNEPTQESVEYIFNEKMHKYRVNFQINELLIEIKDFHVMHKNQVLSGKWDAKIEAIKKMGVKYYFITPNNWNVMLNELKNILKN